MDVTTASAVDIAAAIADGSVSATEITHAALQRIEHTDGNLNAFLHVDADGARAQAKAVDDRRAAGEALPVLAGVPVAVKDVLTTTGMPTTCGSRMLEHWTASYDATVVRKLKQAGAVIVGKTNMDEFAMGSSTENSAYGPTRNPWNTDRIPGGSSGGSAVAVAARQVPLSIGTDTGGSIRQPAAMTGVVGVKPTYGGVSRYGLVALASSLDQAGPFARSVQDAALLHSVIAGHDPLDSTSIDAPVPDVVTAAKDASVAGMRVGLIRQLRGVGFQSEVETAFDRSVAILSDLGAEVVEIDCPNFEYAISAYYLILPSEASSNLAKFDAMRYGLRVGDGPDASVESVMAATREQGFGAEVKRRIMLGTYALSSGYYEAYYGQAQKVRTLIARDFANAFEAVDVLASPTSPTTAWPIGEKVDDPLAMYLQDIATIPANLAGLPGMSLPVGIDDSGLPIGVQFMAPALADDRLYRVGAALESRIGWEPLA